MKTVGIVTYFKSYNYGVWLQAYATERFFEKDEVQETAEG